MAGFYPFAYEFAKIYPPVLREILESKVINLVPGHFAVLFVALALVTYYSFQKRVERHRFD
jgi:hypothetical protein